MVNRETEDLILRYLHDKTEENEKQAFEKRLENDAELREEYNFHKAVKQGVALNFLEEKKQLLKEHEQQKYGKNTQGKKLYLLAAAVILVAAIGFTFNFFMHSQSNSSQIAMEAFEPFPNYLTEQYRSGEATEKPDWLKAGMNAYDSGDYPKAVKLLEIGTEQYKEFPLAGFYLGNAYLSLDKAGKAADVLKSVKGKLGEKYRPHLDWYLALAYLANDETGKAKPLLKKVREQSDDYKKRAGDLLAKL